MDRLETLDGVRGRSVCQVPAARAWLTGRRSSLFNCLLHVPNADLPAVLAVIRALLRPDGLFFLGVYGGQNEEGVVDNDQYDPPRFFSFRTSDQLFRFVTPMFDVVDFHMVEVEDVQFQSMTLRAKAEPS